MLTWLLAGVLALTAEPELRPVPLSSVDLTDGFWAQRQRVITQVTIPAVFEQCEKTGRIANFQNAARKNAAAGSDKPGKHQGYFFNDSDVYKAIEAASIVIALERGSTVARDLDARLDTLIDTIASAQMPDGYLYTYYQLGEGGGIAKRWTNLKDMHELYCAGHLIEAGVAHFQATGKTRLLNVAIRLADLIDSVFGPTRVHGVCGHEEIEIALIKLWRATGQQRYLDLARYFINQRGSADGRELFGEYCQDDRPLRQQTGATGHAVRAMYFYTAAADLAAIDRDGSLITALGRIWEDVTSTRMYVTGGTGNSASNEGFTRPYDLPNDTAYAETCAGIGLALWSHRMALLHADARYADVMERALYNGVLSGVSLSGDRFFYSNPLASRGQHERQAFYACACCPPNIERVLAGVGAMFYAVRDGEVYVNLYGAGRAQLPLGGSRLTITQKTDYPWNGRVHMDLAIDVPASLDLMLRLPGWSEGATLTVNGQPTPIERVRGYARIGREWKDGDAIDLDLPMPPVRIEPDAHVKANAGRTAVARGPIVYCIEGVDNNGHARNLALPRDAAISVVPNQGPGGTIQLRADGWARTEQGTGEPVRLTMVPYFAWANRGKGEMAVWVPTDVARAEPPPVPGIIASASHCNAADSVRALCDRAEPENSADESIIRMTFWPHKGAAEWVQYDFVHPREVAETSVYWFDDSGHGACATPASWRALWRDGQEWKAVELADDSAFGVAKDRFNVARFKRPVLATGLRLEIALRDGKSAGILEWKVGP